jgi:nucleoside-diphosphate-sugar epimerase
VDFNGVHKYAATMYHLMLSRNGLLDACVLRLTNVYGPGMSLDVPGQGFLSTYLRKLSLGERLEVFGDGLQLRDPMYVDDAVDAFLLAGLAQPLTSRSYNVGGPEALTLLDIARLASAAAGVDEPTLRPFPEERKKIDIGSYRTDSRRIQAELGWTPRVQFEDGIALTLAHYRKLADEA